MSRRPLSQEELKYKKDAEIERKLSRQRVDLGHYFTDSLRDQSPVPLMTDDLQRGNTESRYRKLTQMENLARSEFLPFAPEMCLANRQPDPRGWTNDPLLSEVKKYSYKRTTHTEANLYPRDMPVAVIDTQPHYNQLQKNYQAAVRNLTPRL